MNNYCSVSRSVRFSIRGSIFAGVRSSSSSSSSKKDPSRHGAFVIPSSFINNCGCRDVADRMMRVIARARARKIKTEAPRPTLDASKHFDRHCWFALYSGRLEKQTAVPLDLVGGAGLLTISRSRARHRERPLENNEADEGRWSRRCFRLYFCSLPCWPPSVNTPRDSPPPLSLSVSVLCRARGLVSASVLGRAFDLRLSARAFLTRELRVFRNDGSQKPFEGRVRARIRVPTG